MSPRMWLASSICRAYRRPCGGYDLWWASGQDGSHSRRRHPRSGSQNGQGCRQFLFNDQGKKSYLLRIRRLDPKGTSIFGGSSGFERTILVSSPLYNGMELDDPKFVPILIIGAWLSNGRLRETFIWPPNSPIVRKSPCNKLSQRRIRRDQQEIQPEHLLLALLTSGDEGTAVVPNVLQLAGADPRREPVGSSLAQPPAQGLRRRRADLCFDGF